MDNWSVYLLECSDKTFYCGITNNLTERLERHNQKKGAKYTRGRTPVKIIESISGLNKSEALKLEIKIKALKKSQKISFFINYKNNHIIGS